MDTPASISDYPFITGDKVRYSDTDRLGHVNNAVFLSFLETGHVELLENPESPIVAPGANLVLATVTLDFVDEIRWPGDIRVGTRVTRLGRSSIAFEQALFQGERCVARASDVLVQVDAATKKALPFGEKARVRIEAMIGAGVRER